jgi:acetyl-CoA carboxylase, biotin carboxylase subunit
LARALDEYYAGGIKTNVGLFRRILREPEFREGAIHTGWLDEFLKRRVKGHPKDSRSEEAAIIAAALRTLKANASGATSSTGTAAREESWKAAARREQIDRDPRGS